MTKKTTHMITFPWFNQVLNPNNRKHWSIKSKAKKKQRQDAYNLTHHTPKPVDYELDIIFNPPCKRRRDLDNCLSSIKSLLDGVASAWGADDYEFRPRIKWGAAVKYGSVIIVYNIDHDSVKNET